MPVIAKLSREFYDTLGNKVADELVNWFNQVDATYRAELKDLFEVHFSRFDAKLDQFRAQFDAKLDQLEARFDAKLERLRGDVDGKLERRLAEQTRWLFGAWVIVLGAVIGLWFRG